MAPAKGQEVSRPHHLTEAAAVAKPDLTAHKTSPAAFYVVSNNKGIISDVSVTERVVFLRHFTDVKQWLAVVAHPFLQYSSLGIGIYV